MFAPGECIPLGYIATAPGGHFPMCDLPMSDNMHTDLHLRPNSAIPFKSPSHTYMLR
jgi:hypothetical protein